MASFAKQISLFFLLTLLSSLHTHARDSQFFNKIPSTTTTKLPQQQQEEQQEQQEPNFVPDNENAYGLYGHESGQLPPSTTTNLAANYEPTTTTTTTTRSTTPYNTESKLPPNKHLPKNYNPVSYVTEPEEDINDSETFTQEKSYNTNPTNYKYNNFNQQYQEQENDQESDEYRNNNNNVNNNNNNYYYKGMSETRFRVGGATTNSRAQPQGLSDTRFMENGKYFYDVNTENKNEYRNMNVYGKGENNGYEFNNNDDSINGGYQTQDNAMP